MSKKLISIALALLILLSSYAAETVFASDIIILNKLSMEVNDETDLTFFDPNGKKISVDWICNDTSICTVNDKGTVKGKKAGVCIVYTTWKGNQYGIKITVKEEEKVTPFTITRNYLINNGKKAQRTENGVIEYYKVWIDGGMHIRATYFEDGVLEFSMGKPNDDAKLGSRDFKYEIILSKSKSKKNRAYYYKYRSTDFSLYTASPKKGTLNVSKGIEFKRAEGSKKVSGANTKANRLLIKGYPKWNSILQKYTGTSMSALGFKCKKVSLSKTTLSLKAGTKYTLKLKNAVASRVTWSSSDKRYALVSSKGVVRAKRAGSAVITAKHNGYKYKCKVTIIPK